jgi:hypothetical protein
MCVEVQIELPLVMIRDSKYRRDPSHNPVLEPTITIGASQWADFLAESTGQVPAGTSSAIAIVGAADGTTGLVSRADGTTLVFTGEEWAAFTAGVSAGEFALPAPALV